MTEFPTLEECAEATSTLDYIIGEGKDRQGYHIPGSRWVYKLAKYPNRCVNQAEYDRYCMLKSSDRIPKGIYFPEMYLLENGVLAAEYIDGDRPKYCPTLEHEKHYKDPTADCWENIVNAFAYEFNLYDSSSGCNVRIVIDNNGEEKIYIIDLGE